MNFFNKNKGTISKERNPHFFNLFEKLDDYILIFSFHEQLLYANPSILAHLGYTIDEFQGKSISDLFVEETGNKVWQCFSRLPLNKKNKLNLKIISKTGKLIPVEMTVSRATLYNETVFVCIPRDITVRINAEKALRESERKLTTLLSNLPGMAYRAQNNREWTMEFVSEGCYELTGYSQSELVGKNSIPWVTLIHPDDREPMWHEVQNAIREKRAYRFVFRLTTAEGKEKWVWEQGIGVFSDNRKIIAVEGFITDFTHQKKIELQLNKENQILRSTMKNPIGFGNIIGQSPAMRNVFERILKAANSAANVIIFGESGTGKELVANAIHKMSERGDKAFIPVNCGAIPENLIESEFFGYQKGAFSGAFKNKPGFLDLADEGTLFLDEIGEIDKNFQVKLLRALEGNGYTPVGGSSIKKPNIRIIAATNKDLNDLMKKDVIREDFFYRINILRIKLPPLRERKKDIPLLIEHFLEMYNNKGEESITIPQSTLDSMLNYTWPGNIRELQNVIQRYVASREVDSFDKSKFVNTSFKPNIDTKPNNTHKINHKEAVDIFEKTLILETLEKHRWHRGNVASKLGMNYRTLLRKMKKYGISLS